MKRMITLAAVGIVALTSHAFAQRRYEGIRVMASNQYGTPFQNMDPTRVRCDMTAYGYWNVASDRRPPVDANGYFWLGACSGRCMTNSAPGGALIMRRGTSYEGAGSRKIFYLEPQEVVYFLMNDQVTGTGYRDNRDFLDLVITCSPA